MSVSPGEPGYLAMRELAKREAHAVTAFEIALDGRRHEVEVEAAVEDLTPEELRLARDAAGLLAEICARADGRRRS